MKDRRLIKIIKGYSSTIPVNRDLKAALRHTFENPTEKLPKKRLRYIFAAAAAVLLSLLLPLKLFDGKIEPASVSAATLRVFNQLSFLDIGNGAVTGISESNGTVYIPVFGKGLYRYDSRGYSKLLDGDIQKTSVSPDGKQLALSQAGSLYLHSLESGESNKLLSGSDTIYYEYPAWSGDGKSLLYVKKVIQACQTHGFEVKESGIYELLLSTMETKELAEGSSPSYIPGQNRIVYEKEGKITVADIKTGEEKTVDSGRFPSVSPDGYLLAYVKSENSRKMVNEKDFVETSLENVWIADTGDFSITRQITSNFPNPSLKKDEWLKSLKPSDIPQSLQIVGMYSYYSPSWSSDSKSLFFLKGINAESEAGSGFKVVRADLSTAKNTPEEAVKRYLQALILRDEDYASSLIKNPPEIMTISNPHISGYRITGHGNEGSLNYVDSEVTWSYTADAYYSMEKQRFFLSETADGFIIDSIEKTETTEVVGKQQTVVIKSAGKEQVLFNISDIPSSILQSGNYRLSTLTLSQGGKLLAFSVTPVAADKAAVTKVYILTYDMNTKQFRLLDRIEGDGQDIPVIPRMATSQDMSYISVDVFYPRNEAYSDVLVYNLSTGEKALPGSSLYMEKTNQIHSLYWTSDGLVFSAVNGQESFKYIYDSKLKAIKIIE